MSGKPGSVGAPRAGVAAGRVLVYVEPRQLEPAARPPPPRQPAHSLYRQHQAATALYYRPPDDNDKLTVYGSAGNIQRAEFYPVSHQYLKDTTLKIEDTRPDREQETVIKQDSVERVEFTSGETLEGRIVESELATYQARCSGGAGDMPVQQVAIRQGHNQFSESVTVHSADITSERESGGKSYLNYQFLEQSVSHQSIVNQSISILNQQVGVSGGLVSEGESGRLVRTVDGVVLAVLPAPLLTDTADNTTAVTDSPQTITVPLGWRRIVTGTSVLYISPSGTALSTLPQLREYLQTAGTCKCGLPCPLRPETAFNFDSKVVSKPYQVASGAELTKLCNHKRKLLATLQARGQSPATPPPQNTDLKKVGTEVAVLKKKMKKRPGFPANVSVSQLMVQRERPLAEFKGHDTESVRDVPAIMGQQRSSGQPLPTFPNAPHNMLNTIPQDTDPKQETHVQRSSHYLTVNNGWITQQNSEGQKPNQSPMSNHHTPGIPVLGTNGQIIGVNTGYKHSYKNVQNIVAQNLPEPEQKELRKDMHAQQNVYPSASGKHNYNKDEESQIFCGLNQPLTPEVMQKINEQQQIFIQQNQKQIEMAMKGYRNQLADNANQSKPQGQFAPQGQLVIQNGTVVKTNPAKTPPWQVKRNDGPNPMISPNLKLQKLENTDYEESNATMSEDSSSSFSSFSSNEQGVSQGMCSRVPPLPQHYNNMMTQQWPTVETNKRKGKANNKGGKKKHSPTENKVLAFGNNGMRHSQDSKGNHSDEMTSNSVPSFMDDPSGYLAQQTVLLNNTISRQVGMNPAYEGGQFDGLNNPSYIQQHQRPPSKPGDVPNVYRNSIPNTSPSPNTTPDSSVFSDKGLENTMSQCCKGCNVSSKGSSPEYVENQMRLKYMKHNNMYKMELDGNSSTSSPKHSFDDSPVTSSTFIERNQSGNGNCSPIQAGTVSTSNVAHTETLQPPEPSPTLSNSSRNTDTPHSSGSNNSQIQHNPSYPSPAYMCRDFNTSTPAHQVYYNAPGPTNTQSITGTQMMHFISNHNVNKNLMEVDNISMVGVKPGMKSQDMYRVESRRRVENSMPGYCPPPHMGGGPAHSLIQACYIQTFVTTMASGFSVTRDTVTSVLAGKANTSTTSINASQANFIRPPPPPSVNLATTYAIPNNQPDPFLNSVNLPTSYPLHIAGTTAQNMISKSPLEMVQNVIGSLPSKPEMSIAHTTSLSQMSKRTTPGQILISSTGQIIVSNNQMPPPPPKTSSTLAGHASSVSSGPAATSSVSQMVGGVQSIVNQPTVVVNTLPTPFVIQPPMMAVDGQVVQQNAVMPQLVGGLVPGQQAGESRQIDIKSHQSYVQGVAMLSPESLKKKSKKKKSQPANITNVLQITAPQQNPGNIMVHSSPQHNTSPQFSPRGFQLSPNNNISPTPMLQALTIVPGKSGTPAHIVMNGQGNPSNFGSQQIIANHTSPSQQINLLQPVNLINNASGVMSNFPFQQFIMPNLGGMMMTADGTTLIQDNSTGMPMQLQLQTVNGQNVLTPVQNQGVFAAGANGGVVLRAQNQQGKIIQSQHSPGAQFLSPSGQMMMNGPSFNGQLSPLLANLSPTSVTFGGQAVRPGTVPAQDFMRGNQAAQAVMVPLSPKRVSLASNRSNSTFVQNTTIVQQQTTLVASAAEADSQARHSVSTQTARKSPAGSSPPDTTTHSPLGALEPPASPRRAALTYADTTTESPEPSDAASSAMVQCVSSSEPDMAESREHVWPAPRNDFNADNDQQNLMSNMPMLRQTRPHNPVESTDIHYNQPLNPPQNQNQHVMPIPTNYYERTQTYKRKNDFGDGSTYRSDKIMRTNSYNMVHAKDNEYDLSIPTDKNQSRHYQASGSSTDPSLMPKVFDRHNLGSSNDADEASLGERARSFSCGDLVWGPLKGYPSWPGCLVSSGQDGRWLVRWFGGDKDKPPARVPAALLLTLSEGLEAHHAARTRHRKSRKLNTLLENAIQEAMAELDKKSDGKCETAEGTSADPSDAEPIVETPKRSKKHDKLKTKDKHHKKVPVKIAPNPNKTGDGARLRSSR